MAAAVDRLQTLDISRELEVPETKTTTCKKEPDEPVEKSMTQVIAGSGPTMDSINDLYIFGYPNVEIGKFKLNAVTFHAAMKSIETFLCLRALSNPKAITDASIDIMAVPKKKLYNWQAPPQTSSFLLLARSLLCQAGKVCPTLWHSCRVLTSL